MFIKYAITAVAIARSEVQMGTGNEFLNFNLIKKWDPSYERSCEN